MREDVVHPLAADFRYAIAHKVEQERRHFAMWDHLAAGTLDAPSQYMSGWARASRTTSTFQTGREI
eukprot:7762530-Pyramimonas_sp.AAC.1